LPAYADVIYDEQTYDYWETYTRYSIWGEAGYETADDFEVEGYWTLELVRVWLCYSGEQDIRVDIFSNGADNKPGSPPPGDLYYEEVTAGAITWTDTGDSGWGYPFYQLDIPITGFDIEPATRYWVGLQSISGDNSYWLVTLDLRWVDAHWFYEGNWHGGGFIRYDCEFELHGTPVTGVETASLGEIKALFR
jgi:hypothetical protein